MPKRTTETPPQTHQTLKNMSYESMLISWLMYDGWQVFTPVLDNGHQTDILVSDGPHYYRIQVKTVEAKGQDHIVENKWHGSHIDLVVYIARNSTWGFIAPAFQEDSRPLNHKEHKRFKTNDRNEFLNVFHTIDM